MHPRTAIILNMQTRLRTSALSANDDWSPDAPACAAAAAPRGLRMALACSGAR